MLVIKHVGGFLLLMSTKTIQERVSQKSPRSTSMEATNGCFEGVLEFDIPVRAEGGRADIGGTSPSALVAETVGVPLFGVLVLD